MKRIIGTVHYYSRNLRRIFRERVENSRYRLVMVLQTHKVYVKNPITYGFRVESRNELLNENPGNVKRVERK